MDSRGRPIMLKNAEYVDVISSLLETMNSWLESLF